MLKVIVCIFLVVVVTVVILVIHTAKKMLDIANKYND